MKAKCGTPLEHDTWALLSDESEQYHLEFRGSASPASSMVGVARMVAGVSSFGRSHKTLHFSSRKSSSAECGTLSKIIIGP